VRQASSEGAVAGYPIVDIRVMLVDGSYHEVDSSDMAFQIAGAMALRKAVSEAGPVLLEPIMEAEITIPEECLGAISGDINSRRGRIMGMEIKGKTQIVKAQVALSEMSKYTNDLRSITAGRGSYLMHFPITKPSRTRSPSPLLININPPETKRKLFINLIIMKISVIAVPEIVLGKHNIKDSRLDQADKLVKAKKKTYPQVEVAGEDAALEADIIMIPGDAKADLILKDLDFVETRSGQVSRG